MADKQARPVGPESLARLMPEHLSTILTARGSDLVQQVGREIIRGAVYDVLTGKNLRDSTESLTRRRIASVNAATLAIFLRGSTRSGSFISSLPDVALEMLRQRGVPKHQRWLAQWLLGLTDKAVQNVLRDDPTLLEKYAKDYIAACQDAIARCATDYGILDGELRLGSEAIARIDWLFMTYLLNAIGAQTLTIRGSEKSAYGKLFERLVLGSLLHILGFEQVSADDPRKLSRVFWLSSQGEKRESDATVLIEAGRGVRFDIGFIGRGNPEISLDKVSRFEREVQFGRSRWYMSTIIIVDRIGASSRITGLARSIGGTIVQMSMAYWPQLVAQQLQKDVGYAHELAAMPTDQVAEYLKTKMSEVPLESYLENSGATRGRAGHQ